MAGLLARGPRIESIGAWPAGWPRLTELAHTYHDEQEKSAMRIHLDLDACTGHGVSEALAEDIFEVNDDGYVDLLDATPGEDHRPAVQEAVAQCPTRALRLTD